MRKNKTKAPLVLVPLEPTFAQLTAMLAKKVANGTALDDDEREAFAVLAGTVQTAWVEFLRG